MATTNEADKVRTSGTTTTEETSLNKPTRRAEGNGRRSQFASIELATSAAAEAVAAGWKVFCERVSAPESPVDGTLNGAVEAAATLVEGLAGATRRSYGQSDEFAQAPASPIDYQQLAKLVVAGLRSVMSSKP
jgi:hypothetical protein